MHSKIEDILINSVLKEFYHHYTSTGTGHIFNHKGGAMLYDRLMKEHPFEVPTEEKKRIWKECKDNYQLFYSQYNQYPKDKKKEFAERFYKSGLVEWQLRAMLKEDGSGQIVTLDDSPTDILGINKIIVE